MIGTIFPSASLTTLSVNCSIHPDAPGPQLLALSLALYPCHLVNDSTRTIFHTYLEGES